MQYLARRPNRIRQPERPDHSRFVPCRLGLTFYHQADIVQTLSSNGFEAIRNQSLSWRPGYPIHVMGKFKLVLSQVDYLVPHRDRDGS